MTMIRTLAAVLFCASLAMAQPNPAGHWQGKIQVPNREMPVTVDLARNASGAWIGSMTVATSTSVDVPLTGISVDDGTVKFSAALPERATFSGRFSADGAKLLGTASNAAGEAPFELARAGEANVKVPPPSTALPKEFEGAWEGALEAGGKTVPIAMKLTAAPDGQASAILTAEGKDVPASTVTVKDKLLDLELRAVSGTYHGTLGANGEIAGEWTQRGNHMPLSFRRAKP